MVNIYTVYEYHNSQTLSPVCLYMCIDTSVCLYEALNYFITYLGNMVCQSGK